MKPGPAAIAIGQQIGGIALLFDMSFGVPPTAPKCTEADADERWSLALAPILRTPEPPIEIPCCAGQRAFASTEAA